MNSLELGFNLGEDIDNMINGFVNDLLVCDKYNKCMEEINNITYLTGKKDNVNHNVIFSERCFKNGMRWVVIHNDSYGGVMFSGFNIVDNSVGGFACKMKILN